MTETKNIYQIGYTANNYTRKLIIENFEKLATRYTKTYLNEGLSMLDDLENLAISTAKLIKSRIEEEILCTKELGLFGTLWQLGKYYNCGIKVYQEKILIKQLSNETANFFDYNPCEVPSENTFLFFSNKMLEEIIEDCKEEYVVRRIGYTTNDNNKVVINGEVTRFLSKPSKP